MQVLGEGEQGYAAWCTVRVEGRGWVSWQEAERAETDRGWEHFIPVECGSGVALVVSAGSQ